MSGAPLDWIRFLDLTRLEAREGDDEAVAALCHRAIAGPGHVAAVCIYPAYVRLARRLLRGTDIAIATVANFPGGDQPLDQVLAAVEAALRDGATEIDVVAPYGRWMQGDRHAVSALIDPVVNLCAARALVKVILETGLIPSSGQRQALARECARPGVAFLKTSTGKARYGATVDGVEDLAQVLARLRDAGRCVGLKIAGGVRTRAQLLLYHEIVVRNLGARFVQPETLRIGASSLLDALQAAPARG